MIFANNFTYLTLGLCSGFYYSFKIGTLTEEDVNITITNTTILYMRAVSKSQTWNFSSIKLFKTWLYLYKQQKPQTCPIYCKLLMILCLVLQCNLPNWNAERLLILMSLYCGDFGQRSNISYFTWHPLLHKKMPFPSAIKPKRKKSHNMKVCYTVFLLSITIRYIPFKK